MTAESATAGRPSRPRSDLPEAQVQVQVTVVLARLMLGQAAGSADVIDEAAETLLSSGSLAVTDVPGLRASILLAQARSRFTAGRLAEVEPLLRRSADLVLESTAPPARIADALLTRVGEAGRRGTPAT